jgi:ParB-like chromosome segregation protein Spo0J
MTVQELVRPTAIPATRRIFKQVLIKSIDLADRSFTFSYPLYFQKLSESIKQVGIISPVLLRGEKPFFQVIDGLKRILISKENSCCQIEAFIYPEDSLNALESFHLAIQQNIHNRILNPIEKAIILDKLLTQFQLKPREVINHYMPLLDLPPAEKILKRYLSLTVLEEEIKLAITHDEFPLPLAWEIARFSPEERKALFQVAQKLKLGINKMREIIRYLEEISLRDEKPLSSLLFAEEIQKVMREEKMTLSQKGDKIRQILREKRYPKLDCLERKFSQALKKLGLPRTLKITHPPFFEGDKLTLEAQFNSPQALKELALIIQETANKKELDKLLECL